MAEPGSGLLKSTTCRNEEVATASRSQGVTRENPTTVATRLLLGKSPAKANSRSHVRSSGSRRLDCFWSQNVWETTVADSGKVASVAWRPNTKFYSRFSKVLSIF